MNNLNIVSPLGISTVKRGNDPRLIYHAVEYIEHGVNMLFPNFNLYDTGQEHDPAARDLFNTVSKALFEYNETIKRKRSPSDES